MSKIKKSSKLRLGDELVNERIKELGIEVKEGKKTWREVAEQIKEEYGVEISKEAVRKRYESGSIRECNKRKEEEIKEYETRYSDNTIESRKIVEYNKEVFGDNEKLLDYLGFKHNEWEFVYVTMSTWEQHTKEQNTKQLYSVKFKVRPKIKEIDTYRAIEIAKETFKEEIEPITFERKIEDRELGKNKLMLIPQIEAHLGKFSNEIETIKKYDSTNKEKGYNRTTGGRKGSKKIYYDEEYNKEEFDLELYEFYKKLKKRFEKWEKGE